MDYCKHGVTGHCKPCHVAWEKIVDFGVFVWNGKANYPKDAAIKVYRHRSRAERAADKLNETDARHVVRHVRRD